MKDEHTNVFVEMTCADGRTVRKEWGYLDSDDSGIFCRLAWQLSAMESRGAVGMAQDFRAAIQKVLYDTYTKWVLSDD